MAIPHSKPAEPIDIRPLGSELASSRTTTLVKSDRLEVIRLVLPAGKTIAPHQVQGPMTAHCLEGNVVMSVGSTESELRAGTMMYLEPSTKHAVRAVEDSSLLLTLFLVHKDEQSDGGGHEDLVSP